MTKAKLIRKSEIEDYFNEEKRRRERRDKIEREHTIREKAAREIVDRVIANREHKVSKARAQWRLMFNDDREGVECYG